MNSALKQITTAETDLTNINKELKQDGITSEFKREQLLQKKTELENKIERAGKELTKIKEKTVDESQKCKLDKSLEKCSNLKQKIVVIENDIINKPYSNDLPGYSRAELKLYQHILKVLDENLEQETVRMLRKKIIKELVKGSKK